MQWPHKRSAFLGVIGLALASTVLGFRGARQDTGQDQGPRHSQDLLAAGRALYQVQCAYCHGASGKGDGEASQLIFPKPRDLTRGLFTLRSTSPGSPPSDDDLLRTITRGIRGSAMPGFSFLSEREKRSLVQYLKTLSPVFTAAGEGGRVVINSSKPPPRSARAIAAGKTVYKNLGCAACHGNQGRGNGKLGRDLYDDAGFPIRVRNLTSGPFKGGATVSDIYLRITTGMEGTPMPSSAHVNPRDRWNLAYYVESLYKSPSRGSEFETPGVLMSPKSKTALPRDDPFSAVWNNAPKIQVQLSSMWNRGGQSPDIVVRSLNDGETIVFLLEWTDATCDKLTVRPEDFRDSAALQFFAGEGIPSVAMGDRDSEVIIWQWKADWQAHIDQGRRPGPADVHPWMVYETHAPRIAAALQAGNQNALISRSSPVEEAVARGFGTITPKPLAEQQVGGKGVWRKGRWHVVLSRKLGLEGGIAADGDQTKVAFAIWNGNQRDRNGQKAVSTWYTLRLGSLIEAANGKEEKQRGPIQAKDPTY